MSDKRLNFIDCLRGFAVLMMFVFHLCYDINEIYLQNTDWPYYTEIRFWQQCIALGFIFISGMSFKLMTSKKHFINGFKLIVIGEAISLCMKLFMPNEIIIFGVLSFMGWALIITEIFYYCLRKAAPAILSKISSSLGIALCLLAFILTYTIQTGECRLGTLILGKYPQWLYDKNFFFLGFPNDSFFSTDYVPILPHIFMYWLGVSCFEYLKLHSLELLETCPSGPLALLGRHSLIIYLIHQPILLGIVLLLAKSI